MKISQHAVFKDADASLRASFVFKAKNKRLTQPEIASIRRELKRAIVACAVKIPYFWDVAG